MTPQWGRDDGRGPVQAAKGADWRELRNVAALWHAVKAKAGGSPRAVSRVSGCWIRSARRSGNACVAPPRAFGPTLRIGVRAVLSQKGVRRAPLEELILDGLKHRLLASEVVTWNRPCGA